MIRPDARTEFDNLHKRGCRIGKVTLKARYVAHWPDPWVSPRRLPRESMFQAPNLGNVESPAAREARLAREEAYARSGQAIVAKIEAERAAAQPVKKSLFDRFQRFLWDVFPNG